MDPFGFQARFQRLINVEHPLRGRQAVIPELKVRRLGFALVNLLNCPNPPQGILDLPSLVHLAIVPW